MKLATGTAFFIGAIRVASAQNRISGVLIPLELTYLLPEPYKGDINGNFVDTITTNGTINALLAAARNSTLFAYDPEFFSILGPSPTARTIPLDSSAPAHEAGVWVSDYNQVWYTAGGDDSFYFILDLNTYNITTPKNSTLSGANTPNLAGGDYFNGTVYLAAVGSKARSVNPGIYAIDPSTGTSTLVLNSYYGVPLNSIDDLTWVGAPNTSTPSTLCQEPNLFFTTLDLGANDETTFSDAVLPNAVWRFTPSTRTLQGVISRADILAPNGIHASPDGAHLYVTDAALTSLTGPGSNSSGSAAVYKYDLDADCNPVNKRLFALVRSGVADGIHVDLQGRVCTAEFEGIVVRDAGGRELGVFNGEVLAEKGSVISNFALAGDKLVVLAGDRLVVFQLGQEVGVSGGKGLGRR